MGKNWHIRAAVADALASCMESAYTSYEDRLAGIRLPPMDIDYLSEIEHYPVWVVESDDNIPGGLVISFENGMASLANIAVSPGERDRWCANALCRIDGTATWI